MDTASLALLLGMPVVLLIIGCFICIILLEV